MKKFTILLNLVLALTLISQAQKVGNVFGKVTDINSIPVQAATVSLLKGKDSSVLKTAVSDKSGIFQFDAIGNGSYLVSVSAVGHTSLISKGFELSADKSTVQLEPISLYPKANNLKEVVLTSTRPMIEQKIDRTVVNVDAWVSNVGATALEVLEKSPGVQVDKDGNISLKGKQGVIILMDGRPSYLSGQELSNLLKGMQASQIDQIEIMTNPPAKYDAAGNSGVINIKTKKNKAKGLNGSLTTGFGQGVYWRTNESINMNYRKGKVNIFGNYSFSKFNGFQELDIFRRYKHDDKSTKAIFEQTSFMKNSRTNNNLKLGMDYNLDKKTILGVVISGFYNPGKNKGINTSYLQNPNSEIDSIVYATSSINELWKNASINLNVRHQFDSAGRELTGDIDYITYNAASDQVFISTTLTPQWVKKYEEILKGDLPVTIDIYSAKADYTHPLKKGAKIEMGWKSSYVTTKNKANYFEFVNDNYQIDYRKTNYFDYKENINAAYLNLNKQLTEKFGVQTGLRYENTKYTGFQYGNPQKQDSSFENSYNSWFPTVYFSYKASKSNQFGLSYGRRIDRPAYKDLNPFLFYLDKFTYGQGNPYLKPQNSNNFELTHIHKTFLTTTLNYSITNNMFVETFDQDGEYATVVRRGNIGRRRNAGISINAQVPVAKWLTSMIYTNYNYSKYTGDIYGDEIKVEGTNLMVNVNNQFKFKKGWSAELSGWYRSKGIESQMVIQPMGQISAGMSKQVMKGKGSFRFNVRDIFYTQQAKGHINFKSTEARFTNTRDTRVANLTFVYRFGKPLNGNGPRKKESANEEQNRVKTGD